MSKKESEVIGVIGGVIGTVGGTAFSIAAISAGGSVTGLSAAGITSGLAALGGIAGGTMLAGIAVVGGITSVSGYACYRLFKYIF